ncbi:hypothetical protein EDE12_106163 [Methylosinus sp. sav-2]|uniref:hypothetical protein n=1 Tax=Methylosinus sp. sav-2 TaxID=2485168 RepID=UPI00047A4E58|nr:hypothetical protein [Methylosinus sp. sav-2]TDX64018.1 hypothetical protein EDE12_106163 [Methylosinus sp. sav-2]
MRKFWLRAALAASLSRDLCSGCAWAVSWPFRVTSRRLDRIVLGCRARATPAPCGDQPTAGAIWTVGGVRSISRDEYRAYHDAMARHACAGSIGDAQRDDVAAQYIDARSL